MDGQQRYHAWISNGQTLHVHHLLGFKITTNLHWIRNTCFKVSVTFCYKGSSCYYYLHSPTATNIKILEFQGPMGPLFQPRIRESCLKKIQKIFLKKFEILLGNIFKKSQKSKKNQISNKQFKPCVVPNPCTGWLRTDPHTASYIQIISDQNPLLCLLNNFWQINF